MQRNDAWPTGRESVSHLALLITDFQYPVVHMIGLTQELEIAPNLGAAIATLVAWRGLRGGIHLQ